MNGRNINFEMFWGGMHQVLAIVQKQGRCLRNQVASYLDGSLPQKINLISCELIVHISDIKLIRTDTTLDLSQKAEKGMLKTE